jgi:hypothetical protein
MNIDVTAQTIIAAPIATVAAFVSEPDNAMKWYVNIKSVEWQTPRPIGIGSRFAFVAQFLGPAPGVRFIRLPTRSRTSARDAHRRWSLPDGDDVRTGTGRDRHSNDTLSLEF